MGLLEHIVGMFPPVVGSLRRIVASFFLVAAPGWLQADNVTLSPMADTSLSQASQNNNFGAEMFFVSGSTDDALANRALLKFDIANFIPSNAAIQSVTP